MYTNDVELLEEDQRDRLGQLEDVLIPGGLGLPSASEAQASGKWMDRVFVARPDLAEVVRKVIALPGVPADVIAQLQKDEPSVFGDFSFSVGGAYMMNPRVCRLLGMPGNAPKPKPALEDEADYYFRDGILDPVKERGPIYRPTPAAG